MDASPLTGEDCKSLANLFCETASYRCSYRPVPSRSCSTYLAFIHSTAEPKHVVLPHVSASPPQSMHFPGVVYTGPRHQPSLSTRGRGVPRSHRGGWVAATRCCNVRPSHNGDCARAPIRPLMPARPRFQVFWLGFWVKSFLVLGVLLERCGVHPWPRLADRLVYRIERACMGGAQRGGRIARRAAPAFPCTPSQS